MVEFMFGGEVPEEVRRFFDHQQMHQEQHIHDTRNFIQSLNEEGLKALRGIVNTVSENPFAAGYFAGLCTERLSHLHGICVACSRKHDEELAKMAESQEGENE